MTTPERVDGLDLSNWQGGTYDFGAAKRAGLRFVMHKATQGTGFRDKLYPVHRAQTGRAGVPFGAYDFAKPTLGPGAAEAHYFLAYATPKTGDMRPALDFEDPLIRAWSIAQKTDWVGAWVNVVKAETGAPPFIYTPYDLDDNFDCPLWVASYANDNRAPRIPKPWKGYTVWQFSNGVYGWPNSEPGVGHVDLNTMNGDPARLTEIFRLGSKPAAPKPPVAKPPVVQPPAKKPAGPDRVQQAVALFDQGLALLDDAVKAGRTGTVKTHRDNIRREVNALSSAEGKA